MPVGSAATGSEIESKRPKISDTITLVSIDGQRYPIKKYLLMSSSPLFEEMLAVNDDSNERDAGGLALRLDGSEIDVLESKEVLDILIPFFSSQTVDLRGFRKNFYSPPIPSTFPLAALGESAARYQLFFDVVKAIDKLRIARAIESCAALLDRECSEESAPFSLRVGAYVFACHFGLVDLAQKAGQKLGEWSIQPRHPELFTVLEQLESMWGISPTPLQLVHLLKWKSQREKMVLDKANEILKEFSQWGEGQYGYSYYEEDPHHPCGQGLMGLVLNLRLNNASNLNLLIQKVKEVKPDDWCNACSDKAVELLEEVQAMFGNTWLLPRFTPKPHLFA